jgi:hypothetical protein
MLESSIVNKTCKSLKACEALKIVARLGQFFFIVVDEMPCRWNDVAPKNGFFINF